MSWSAVTSGGIRGYRIRYRPITTPESSYSYADSPGSGTSYRLSALGAGLTYEIAVATYDEFNNTSSSYVSGSNVTVGGTPYIASTVDVTGYFSAKANPGDAESTAFKFGYGVDTGKRGLIFNANNYWYIDSAQSASLKVGGSTSNYISWNGAEFVIDGNISARKGSFSGNISLDPGASLFSFQTEPEIFDITAVSYTSTTVTYTTSQPHGYQVGNDVSISGIEPVGYNVVAIITAATPTTFTINNSTNSPITKATGSVVEIAGTGFIINRYGFQFNGYSESGTPVKGITSLDAGTGKFVTKRADIGGWSITDTEIKKKLSGQGGVVLSSNSRGSAYVVNSLNTLTSRIIASGDGNSSEVAIWAGALDPSSLSTINDTSVKNNLAFYVTIDGKMVARNAEIKGVLRGGDLSVNLEVNPVVATGTGYYFDPNGQFWVGSSDTNGTYMKLIDGQLSIGISAGGSFVLGPAGMTTVVEYGSTSRSVPQAAMTYIPSLNQIRLMPKTANGLNTTGIYLDSFLDDQNYGKNDPMVVRSDGWVKAGAEPDTGVPQTWQRNTQQIGRVVKGRRLYWGFGYVPPGVSGGTAAQSSTVAGILDAEAGDLFFSTAVV